MVGLGNSGSTFRADAKRPFQDTNNLFRVATVVGSATTVTVEMGGLRIAGHLKPTSETFSTVIAVDKCGRFLGEGQAINDSWSLFIDPRNFPSDRAALSIELYVLKQANLKYHGLSISADLRRTYHSLAAKMLGSGAVDVPSFKQELRELIVKQLQQVYTASSIHQAIKTGNSYQSVTLDNLSETSGRQSREQYIGQIGVAGRTVLDLGANLGENARLARKLGADLVDAVEYDPFFVEISRTLNALQGTTRVSFFQGDCTNPEFFKGKKYDVVLALNVWVYLTETIQVLPQVADLVLFETHTLDHGMKWYYDRLLPHFPHAMCIGMTDLQQDPSKSRAVIALSTSTQRLQQVPTKSVRVANYFPNSFIDQHNGLSEEQIWQLAAKCFESCQTSGDTEVASMKFGSEEYFRSMLAGAYQFKQAGGVVGDANIFLRAFVRGLKSGSLDPEQKFLLDNDAWLMRKMANKFEDFIQIVSGHHQHVPPIHLLKDQNGHLLFTDVEGATIRCSAIDGHHRLFACQLAGVKTILYTSADAA
jgi:SAM-dependent methyltransferase